MDSSIDVEESKPKRVEDLKDSDRLTVWAGGNWIAWWVHMRKTMGILYFITVQQSSPTPQHPNHPEPPLPHLPAPKPSES